MNASNISVVIVSYNSEKFIGRLLAQLKDSQAVSEIIVVDNGSTDDTRELIREQHPTAVLIENPENTGFGSACNLGAAASREDLLLFVNPDVSLDASVVRNLSSNLANPMVGATGCQLVRSDGTPVSSARAFPTLATTAVGRIVEMNLADHVRDVDWICGAVMMWQRAAFVHIGGFDERFFLYFEDVDICKRASLAGYRITTDPRIVAIHDQGHGVETSPELRRISRASRRKYMQIHHGLIGVASAFIADTLDNLRTRASVWKRAVT